MSPTEPPGSPEASTVIADRYRLDHVIGRGGMGTVWAGTDLLLRRHVAIKDMHVPDGAGPAERQAAGDHLLSEANAAARISDPAVVTVYDVIGHGDGLYLVMEYVAAWSLDARVRQHGPLPANEVAALGARLAGGLSAAHALGVIHCDVKPGNVLVPAEGPGAAKLVDFGIAAVGGQGPGGTTGPVMGSPAFMAPERARGDEATAAGDVFSLGATLYFAAEGGSPFERGDTLTTLESVATEPPAPPRRPGPLHEVLAEMMDKEPGRRPALADVRARLDALAHQPLPATTPATTVTPPAERPREETRFVPSLHGRPPDDEPPAEAPAGRRRWPVLLSALATLGAVAFVALAFLGGGDDDDPAEPFQRNGGGEETTTTAPDGTTATTGPDEELIVPDGFEAYTDPQGGFEVAVPAGFGIELDEANHVTEIVDGDVRIAIQWFEEPTDPRGELETEDARLSSFPRYERLRLEDEEFQGFSGAIWEFRFAQQSDPDLLRSTGRAFEVERITFALFVRATDADFEQLDDDLFGVVRETFDPSASPEEFEERAG